MVEHMILDHAVVGSNPTGAAYIPHRKDAMTTTPIPTLIRGLLATSAIYLNSKPSERSLTISELRTYLKCRIISVDKDSDWLAASLAVESSECDGYIRQWLQWMQRDTREAKLLRSLLHAHQPFNGLVRGEYFVRCPYWYPFVDDLRRVVLDMINWIADRHHASLHALPPDDWGRLSRAVEKGELNYVLEQEVGNYRQTPAGMTTAERHMYSMLHGPDQVKLSSVLTVREQRVQIAMICRQLLHEGGMPRRNPKEFMEFLTELENGKLDHCIENVLKHNK